MTTPTLTEAIGWGLMMGVGLTVALGTFFGLCALLGVEWDDDKEHKA